MLSTARRTDPDMTEALEKNGLTYWANTLIASLASDRFVAPDKDSLEECRKLAQEFEFGLDTITYSAASKKWSLKIALEEQAPNIAANYVGAFFWSPLESERGIASKKREIERIEKKATLFRDTDQEEIDQIKQEIKELKKSIKRNTEETPPILFVCNVTTIKYAGKTVLEICMSAPVAIELAERSISDNGRFSLFLIERTSKNIPQ